MVNPSGFKLFASDSRQPFGPVYQATCFCGGFALATRRVVVGLLELTRVHQCDKIG
jgi:hypothetical protein